MGVDCSSVDIVLTCCDIYDNEGGDWIGVIASQATSNGNFSADPLFCDTLIGDYGLYVDSPCLSSGECGLIGAIGFGCGVPPLTIDTSIPECPIPPGTQYWPYAPGIFFNATGGTPPYSWSQTGLSAGLDIDSATGEIAGELVEAGFFEFVVRVEDSNAGTDERPCSLTVIVPENSYEAVGKATALGLDYILEVLGTSEAPLKAYSMAIKLDPDVFEVSPEVIDTSGTIAVGAEIISTGYTDSTIQVGIIFSYDCPPQIEPGEHLYLKIPLKVRQDAPTGMTSIVLSDLPPALNRMTGCDGSNLVPYLKPAVIEVYEESFIRGDVNGDGELTIADPLANLSYQFLDGWVSCKDAADLDDNGEISITDPSMNLSYQFGSGSPPGFPFPYCGPDTTVDQINCECDPHCMDCRVTAPDIDNLRSSAVVLSLGNAIPVGPHQIQIPVYLQTSEPLWAMEYTLQYPGSDLEYTSLLTDGFDFASGRVDMGSSSIRVGQVVRFDLTEPLPSGGHEVANLSFHVLDPEGEHEVLLVSGIYVQEGGETGSMDVQSLTPVEMGGKEIPGSREFWTTVSPNPFNPTTEIRYGIPHGSDSAPVTVNIYSPQGRKILSLVNTKQGPGTYSVSWNGTSQSGESVGSGIYFYRITWGEKSETRRMVLIR